MSFAGLFSFPACVPGPFLHADPAGRVLLASPGDWHSENGLSRLSCRNLPFVSFPLLTRNFTLLYPRIVLDRIMLLRALTDIRHNLSGLRVFSYPPHSHRNPAYSKQDFTVRCSPPLSQIFSPYTGRTFLFTCPINILARLVCNSQTGSLLD